MSIRSNTPIRQPVRKPYNSDGSYAKDQTYFTLAKYNGSISSQIPSNGYNILREIENTSTEAKNVNVNVNVEFRYLNLEKFEIRRIGFLQLHQQYLRKYQRTRHVCRMGRPSVRRNYQFLYSDLWFYRTIHSIQPELQFAGTISLFTNICQYT